MSTSTSHIKEKEYDSLFKTDRGKVIREMIEHKFDVKLGRECGPDGITIHGENSEKAAVVLHTISKEISNGTELRDSEILSIMSLAEDNALDKRNELKKNVIGHFKNNSPIYPMTLNQARAIEAFENSKTVFLEGEAGTGKTLLALTYAIGQLNANKVDKICICKPTNTVGDEVGFLPGSLAEKTKPTEASFDDKLIELLGQDVVSKHEKAGKILRVPLASIRGRSFDNCIVLIDEAQNLTEDVLKVVATRQGESKFIFCGDGSQSDLNRRRRDEYVKKDESTYTKFVKLLDASKRILNGESTKGLDYSEDQINMIRNLVEKDGSMIKAMRMATISAVYFQKKDVLRSFETLQMLELFDNYDAYMDLTTVKNQGIESAKSISSVSPKRSK